VSAKVTASVDELRGEVHAAFAGRVYPGDEGIVRRRPGCPGLEPERTWERFLGRSYKDIAALGRGESLRDDIAFLTPEGFAYYLPAFLDLALDDDPHQELDGALASYLWTCAEEVAGRLRPTEKRATVRVLEFLARAFDDRGYVRNDARAALEHYWVYFTDAELGQ